MSAISTFHMVWIKIANGKKIYDEFHSSSTDSRVLFIWFTQLLIIVFTLLVNFFKKKYPLKINLIQQLYKSSSPKILLLCFVAEFELIVRCITETIKSQIDETESNTSNIQRLKKTGRKCILNIIKIIIKFMFKILILFCNLSLFLFSLSFVLLALLCTLLLLNCNWLYRRSNVCALSFCKSYFVGIFVVLGDRGTLSSVVQKTNSRGVYSLFSQN